MKLHNIKSSIQQLMLGLICIALLTACDEKTAHQTIRQQGFIYCGYNKPTTFNPQLVDHGITAEALSSQIYNRLLTLDPKSHQPTPSLATSWHISDNALEYTFHLKHNVQFQHTNWFTPSRPLNAQDVVFSFKRIIDKNNPYHMVGGGLYPWFTGVNFQNVVADVIAIDTHTVKFILKQPNFAFLANIATTYSVILSKEYAVQLEKSGQLDRIDQYPVGTGPFQLQEYLVNDLIRLQRHPNYWNGPAKMTQVVFDIAHRGTGTLAKLLGGECDVLTAPISSQLPAIKKNKHLNLTATPANNVAFVAINTRNTNLKDRRVRQALNLAINRQDILDAVYYGTGSRANTLLPPNSWAHLPNTNTIRYDQNYARALLKEAGVKLPLQLSMWVPIEPKSYNPSPRKTAELIQKNLSDIGINLKLITDDRSELTYLAMQTHTDLLLTGWVNDTSDPDNILRPLLSCNAKQAGLNIAMWCNHDFDSLLDLALETKQHRYRLNLYKQAQNILNHEFPVIPLAHGIQFKVNQKSLNGLQSSPFNTLPFNQVERVY